jgi:hypothetical protein
MAPPRCVRGKRWRRGLLAVLSAAVSLVAAGPGFRPLRGRGVAADAPFGGGTPRPADRPSKLLALRFEPARIAAGPLPDAWRAPAFDDRTWAQAPGLVIPRAGLAPGVVVPVGVTAVECGPGGSLYWRRHFDVDAPAAARVLELRVLYLDGFVAYLNGVEIARRNVPAASAGSAPPIAHGSDPERIFVSLPRQDTPLQSRNNVIAVEVRPSVRRLSIDGNAPSTEIGVVLASGVRVVRGPYLIAPADGAVSVAWETDLPARGVVWLQRAPGGHQRTRHVSASKPALRQIVRLTGLSTGARYQYHVDVTAPGQGDSGEDTVQTEPAWFETAPPRDRPLRFVVYGDMRAPGHAAHALVVAGIRREQPALVVNTGDLVAVGGEESAWQRYFEITAQLGASVAVAPALGNHESYAGGAARSWTLFGLRSASPRPGVGYTSFDWGGAHFVILDSNRPDAEQRAWLIRDLAAAKRRHARAIFAILHDGPWSHAAHGGAHVIERDFAPVLAAGGVDVLFSGHDHHYERGVGVTARGPLPYVVSGGGGAPLYNPTCQLTGSPPVGGAPLPPPSGGGTLASAPAPLPACPATVAIIEKTYHYVVVEVAGGSVRLCPRRPDGTAIEPCVELALRSRRQHADGQGHGFRR